MNKAHFELLSVLVIDDDLFMLEIISTSLQQIGVGEISTALNGWEGLQQLDRATDVPNCIICDLHMPQMDGIELLRHLTAKNYKGAVILMSGEDPRVLNTVGNLANAHNLHILGCLSKPVNKQALTSLLSDLEESIQPLAKTSNWSITPAELEASILAGQIRPFFQPQVSSLNRKIVAVEALARWQHPAGKMMPPPDVFVSLAESSGLIDLLTETIYTQTIQQAATWRRAGFELNICINLSMDNLNDLSLPNRLQAIANEAGVNIKNVVLEVTESRLTTNHSAALEILTRLRLMGFALSIDDFGTGYSSLELLNNIPFNELKLDRQFVHGAHKNASSRAILESSITLARKLNMRIVAEGVEDQQDWDLITSLGCDLVQGYFISKPVAADNLSPLLNRQVLANSQLAINSRPHK